MKTPTAHPASVKGARLASSAPSGLLAVGILILSLTAIVTSAAEDVPRDPTEQVESRRNAAEQGDAEAQYNLGILYGKSEGIPNNSAVAVKWWRKAANQGFAAAQYRLAVCYLKGEGVAMDTCSASR